MKKFRFTNAPSSALAKTLAEIRRMHKAGIVSKEIACGMATSLFDQIAAPAQKTPCAKDDGLAERIREFFGECVNIADQKHSLSGRELYYTWEEWSGEDDVSAPVFTDHVRAFLPPSAFKTSPEIHFTGIAFRFAEPPHMPPLPRSHEETKISEENK